FPRATWFSISFLLKKVWIQPFEVANPPVPFRTLHRIYTMSPLCGSNRSRCVCQVGQHCLKGGAMTRVKISSSGVRRGFTLPCCSFGLLQSSRASQCAEHAVVPLMTRILIHRLLRPLHRNLPGPAFRERLRVIDRKFIQQRIRIGASETFHEMHVLAG